MLTPHNTKEYFRGYCTFSRTTLFDLSGFQRDLLTVIAGHDQPSGQQIKTELEDARTEEITHGRLYPNLDVLVNKDYAETGQIDRRINYYEITDEDRTALRKRREWEKTSNLQETALTSPRTPH
nr:PadR family transcriptional regulator [Halegenticoccus tardaugens]